MALLQYIVPRWAAAGSEVVQHGAVEALMRPLLKATTGTSVSAAPGVMASTEPASDHSCSDGGTELRQAALSALLELAKSCGVATWEELQRRGDNKGLREALRLLRERHAGLSPEDREAEQEEDEIAAALAEALSTAPAVEPAAGIGAVDDHVPVDLTEPNLRHAMGGAETRGGLTSAAESKAVGVKPVPLGPGAGAMLACPRVDKF